MGLKRILAFVVAISIALAPAAQAGFFGDCRKQLAGIVEENLTSDKIWKFTKEQEGQFEKIMSREGLSDEQKLSDLFDEMMAARLANTNPVSRFFMRAPLRTTKNQKSIYTFTMGAIAAKLVGPHYNPIFNRVSHLYYKKNAVAHFMNMHELAHAYHRNTNVLEWIIFLKIFAYDVMAAILRTPITPSLRYRMESIAVGAEWEFARRIPPEIRERLIQQLSDPNGMSFLERATKVVSDFNAQNKSNAAQVEAQIKVDKERLQRGEPLGERPIYYVKDFSADFKQLADLKTEHEKKSFRQRQLDKMAAELESISRPFILAALQNADKSKAEFLRVNMPLHGYDADNLLAHHYRWSRWRTALFVGGITPIIMEAVRYGAVRYTLSVLASDLTLLCRLFGI
jgi:hypothetical protein